MPRALLLLSVSLLLVGFLGGAIDLFGDASHCEDSCPSCVACACCLHACPLPSATTPVSLAWRLAPDMSAARAVQGEPVEILHVPLPDWVI
ncbi:MAG: hypothetical protein U0166_01140 [Acidobacteriota bacterium]